MCDKFHRVVVSLTDTMHKSAKNSKETPIDSDVKLLDKTTLLLRSNSGTEAAKAPSPHYYQQLQFDAVGYEEDRHVRCELTGLLDQMMRNLRHGCLLRLTPRRSHNLKLLTHLLVSDLDKILQKLPYQLICINVEYYDVRKFDLVNLLLGSHRSKVQSSKRNMQTTREMFQWLHNEYAVLRGRGTGDDHINVEFVLSEGVHKQHKVHLSIFDIFDCNGRTDINNFFKALPTGKRSKSTLLTDCIKESFDAKQPIFTLVLCEMPLDKECTREMHKFLQLADLVCMSIGATHSKMELQVKSIESRTSLQSRSRMSSSSNQSLDPIRKHSQRNLTSMSLRYRPVSLSHEDYSKLAAWYHRIDTKYAEVKLCMERHYNVQYRQKLLKLCKQLNSCRILTDKSGGDAQGVLLKNSSRDLAASANYMEALKRFRQLEKEVNKSNFAPTLSTYMSTKNYELLNEEEMLQQQETSNLREHRDRI